MGTNKIPNAFFSLRLFLKAIFKTSVRLVG